MRYIKCLAVLNILSVYFYFTGLFKIDKPKTNRTNYKFEKKYKKLVFILLDGLRIDAACPTYNKSLYHNNMKFLYSLPVENKQTFLSVAGVPTATSIRVRSILTGVSSNFLNGTDTFTHSEILEDSFINKIINDSHYFYGDDTWTDLFPVLKAKSTTIPAYGKGRTLDAEILLMNKLVNEIGKYTYALSHFSLLDCYGHDYTIFSKECKAILVEYDLMIKQIYEKMDEETLMVVLSDHGVNDDGSHGGGNIKEISSTGIFISKKEFELQDNEGFDAIRNSYTRKIYDADEKWVMSKDKLKIIHQNDIVPTICALIGLPIPFNCIGNLVHELVGNDSFLYKKVLEQKLESIDLKLQKENLTETEVLEMSYKTSEKIRKKFSGIHIPNLVISFLCLAIFVVTYFWFNINLQILSKQFIFAFFIICMISHSVYSVIHEDLLWGMLLLYHDLSAINIFAIIYFLMIGKYPQHEEDRFYRLDKIGNYFDSNLLFIKIIIGFYLVLFLLNQKKSHKHLNFYKQITTFMSQNLDINLFYILLKYFNKTYLNEHKSSFLTNNFSLESLSFLLYDPPTLFFMHCVIPKLQIKNVYQAFAISNMSLFYIGMNQALSSINYDVPFLFGDQINKRLGSLLMLYHFIYPRLYIYKISNMQKFIQLSTVHTIATMVIGIWFIDNHLFYFFFGGRCFFTCFYYVVENIVYMLK